MVACLTVGFLLYAVRQPMALATVPLLLAASILLNQRHCRFFYRTRGLAFACRAWIMRFVHDLCNALSFVVGTLLFAGTGLVGIALPGGLPAQSWSATQPRVASRTVEQTAA